MATRVTVFTGRPSRPNMDTGAWNKFLNEVREGKYKNYNELEVFILSNSTFNRDDLGQIYNKFLESDAEIKIHELKDLIKKDLKGIDQKKISERFAKLCKEQNIIPFVLGEVSKTPSEIYYDFNENSFLSFDKIREFFLKNKTPIPEIDKIKSYEIKSTTGLICKESINELFNKILKSKDPEKEEVINFFKELFHSHGDEDSELVIKNNANVLFKFFTDNKKELAYIFTKPDFEIEKFQALTYSLTDGCFVNISSQFDKILYHLLNIESNHHAVYMAMQKAIDQNLYKVPHLPVVSGKRVDYLQDPILNNCHIHAESFLKEIQQNLDDCKASEIVFKNLTKKKYDKHKILEEFESVLNKGDYYKKFASYILLEEI